MNAMKRVGEKMIGTVFVLLTPISLILVVVFMIWLAGFIAEKAPVF